MRRMVGEIGNQVEIIIPVCNINLFWYKRYVLKLDKCVGKKIKKALDPVFYFTAGSC